MKACISTGIDQTAEAMRILLRTDDFLMVFLNYLNNSKFALSDSFLTSGKVMQNILEYSKRNSSAKAAAESYLDAVINEMNSHDIHRLETNCIDESIADENFMIIIVLYAFPKLMISQDYRSWCLRIRIDKNSESRIMRAEVEMNYEFRNLHRILELTQRT